MEPIRKEVKLKNGMTIPWYEYKSDNSKGEKIPLVFCLHGGEGDGYHAFECGNLKAAAEKHSMIIVSPYIENFPRSFSIEPDSREVAIAKEFYDKICEIYRGQYSRKFVMGYSIGEYIAFLMCRKYEGLVDAFAGAVAPAPPETYTDKNGELIFSANQKPIPAFLWRGGEDYLYSIYKTGKPDKELQSKVVKGYRDYWAKWNNASVPVIKESAEELSEIYQKYDKPLIHITAYGMHHEDEKNVFEKAWEMLFSRYV